MSGASRQHNDIAGVDCDSEPGIGDAISTSCTKKQGRSPLEDTCWGWYFSVPYHKFVNLTVAFMAIGMKVTRPDSTPCTLETIYQHLPDVALIHQPSFPIYEP